jgi:hypothetical protein
MCADTALDGVRQGGFSDSAASGTKQARAVVNVVRPVR